MVQSICLQWSGVEGTVFPFQFPPDSLPISCARCQLSPGSIFLLGASALGNLDVQESLDCKIATFKINADRQPRSGALGRGQRGGATRLGLSPGYGELLIWSQLPFARW